MKRYILAASLALALGACGNGGDTGAPEPKKAETSTPTPTPTAAPTTAAPAPVATPDAEPKTPSAVYAALPAPYNTADPEKGEKLFRQCIACHRIDETGKHKTGPNLHGVIGKKAGHVEDFNYSKAMHDANIIWSPETLDEYLTNPRAYVPGTRMSYAGLRRPADRTDLIAYLMVKSEAPDE